MRAGLLGRPLHQLKIFLRALMVVAPVTAADELGAGLDWGLDIEIRLLNIGIGGAENEKSKKRKKGLKKCLHRCIRVLNNHHTFCMGPTPLTSWREAM